MKKTIALISMLLLTGWILTDGQTTSADLAPEKGGKAFKGYFNITDMGLLIGSTQNQHPAPFSFMTINGYHLTGQLSLGLGVGVEFLSGSYMPIVADARYYVRNTRFSPFFSLSGGYSLALSDDGSNGTYYDATYSPSSSFVWMSYPYQPYVAYTARGGWLFNPGFGIRYLCGENFGIIFSAGYRVQRLYYKAADDRKLLADYNRLALKIGIIFR